MLTYKDVQTYYDAIADNALADVEGGGCPHKRFWRIPYANFKSQEVPGLGTHHVKIINDAAPEESLFYKILLGPITIQEGAATKTYKQMPDGGPFITDAGYSIPINGVNKTGDQIKQDLLTWLTGGMPELAAAPVPVNPVNAPHPGNPGSAKK